MRGIRKGSDVVNLCFMWLFPIGIEFIVIYFANINLLSTRFVVTTILPYSLH